MRRFITERNLVIVLFVMVIITFSFAERDTKKIEHLYIGNTPAIPSLNTLAELKLKTAAQTLTLATELRINQ
jgi:hypothetical protein